MRNARHSSIIFLIFATLMATCRDQAKVVTDYGVANRSIEERYTSIIPWQQGLALGNGLDSLSMEVKTASNALDFDVDNPEHYWDPVCHYQRKMNYKFIQSRNEMEMELGIHTRIKVNLKIAKVRGAVHFINSIRFNKKNIYIFIQDYRLNCEHRIKNPILTTSSENLFKMDPGRFQSTYGDKFLNVVTTGGSFYGLLEIESDDNRHKMVLKAKVRLRALGRTVGKHRWYKVLRNILTEPEIRGRIYVQSNNAPPTKVIELRDGPTERDVVTRFMEKYEEFLKRVSSPGCNGASKLSYRSCPFLLGRFEDYATIARSACDSEEEQCQTSLIEQQLPTLERLSSLHSKYKRIRYEITEIEENPLDYTYLDTEQPTSLSIIKDRTSQLIARTNQCLQVIEEKHDLCQQNIGACALGPIELFTICQDSLLDIRRDLPGKRKIYPKDCSDLAQMEHTNNDGEYTVYMGGARDKPFQLYCDFDEKKEDKPEAYLTLKKTSPPGERPTFNFAQYRNAISGDGEVGTTLTSTYRKIRIFIQHDSAYLDPSQDNYVETRPKDVSAYLNNANTNTTQRFLRASFGHAYSCQDHRSQVSANIDLTGLPFVVAEDAVFENLFSTDTSGQEIRHPGGRSIDLTLFSRNGCSDIAPVHGLRLEYEKEGR